MPQNPGIAPEISEASSNVVSALDELDLLTKLSSILEVSSLLPSENAYLLQDIYAAEMQEHLKRLQQHLELTQELLASYKSRKVTQAIVKRYRSEMKVLLFNR